MTLGNQIWRRVHGQLCPSWGSVGLGAAGGLGKAQPTGAPLPGSWCSEESRGYAQPTPLASPSWMDTGLQPRRTWRSQGGQGRASTGRAEEQAALGTEVQPPGTAGSLGALHPLTALCRPPRKPVRSRACGRRDGQGAEGRPAGDQPASNPAPSRWGGPQAHPAPNSRGPGGPLTPRAQQCPRGTPGTAGLRHSRPVGELPLPTSEGDLQHSL